MQLHQKNDSLEQDLKVVRKRHHELAVSRFSSNKTTSQKKNLKQNKQQKGTYKKESSDSQEQSDSDSSSEISSPADSANESSHDDELKAAKLVLKHYKKRKQQLVPTKHHSTIKQHENKTQKLLLMVFVCKCVSVTGLKHNKFD